MSLVVWLPLDGDLLNHGLSDINVTNNGATVNNNGKIGRCYYFNGSSQFLQFSKSLGDIYSGDFSWALWVKPADDTRGILISEYSAAGASNVALEFYTNRKLRVYWNGSPDYYPNYTLPKDVWTHVAVTKTASNIKVYINGEFLEERNGSLSARPSTAAIRIGDDYRGGTSVSYMGYINDVRIYDHCLSAREVHEISKALFLHYKLDDKYSNTIVYDTSGYRRDGTIIGTCTLSTDVGKYDKSLSFAAGNNHISSPTLYTGGIQNTYTVTWWAKSTAMNGKMPWGSNNGNRLNLYPSGTVFYWNTGDGSNNPIKNGSTNVTFASYQGAWHHYAMTGDGTSGKLYIDGSLVGTATTYKPLTATVIYICGWDSTTSYVWTGNVSDFRIYGTALSAEDVYELAHTPAYVDNQGDIMSYSLIEENIEPKIYKSGLLKSNNFRESYAYLYLPAGSYINTGVSYAAGDTCRAETVIRYATGGSGRDLMGYSGAGAGYWGVTAAGAWEPHGTFSYTNSDISVPNLVTYQFTSNTESGTYQIGRLASSYTVRNKYIYNVKLYKNGVLQRNYYPDTQGNKPGLFDILNGVFYPATGSNIAAGIEENDIVARIFKNHVEATQFIEI